MSKLGLFSMVDEIASWQNDQARHFLLA